MFKTKRCPYCSKLTNVSVLVLVLQIFGNLKMRGRVVFSSAVKKLKNYNIQDDNLPVLLYGCKTWSLTLRGEHRLRVFENRVLRRIFGPKRDEVMGERRKLHNKELRDLYS
jgi:hypothetical protein